MVAARPAGGTRAVQVARVLSRIPIDPSPENGLARAGGLMVDKLTTMPKSGVGDRLGRLRDDGRSVSDVAEAVGLWECWPVPTRGFFGRRRVPEGLAVRLPPGQYFEEGFPVLTAGLTPRISTSDWSFTIEGRVAEPRTWSWDEAHALAGSTYEGDIHCVTRWSKLGTSFSGVSVDTLLDLVGVDDAATHVLAFCHGGYTTNLPLADVRGGQAWIAWVFEGGPLPAEHGGPARLLVPHLYFWKSAKWIKGLRLLAHDEPGFWERNGYHDYGDPWKEQRFQGD